jgi:hypothetical protein
MVVPVSLVIRDVERLAARKELCVEVRALVDVDFERNAANGSRAGAPVWWISQAAPSCRELSRAPLRPALAWAGRPARTT